MNLEEIKISERIKSGIKMRLSYQIPYIGTWHQGMAIGAQPLNISTTLTKLWKISDDIWYIAGDRSTDYNWYTKRSLLFGTYTSTELYMLTDKSDDFSATWAFLDRRVQEILDMGQNINTVRNVGGAVFGGLSALAHVFHRVPETSKEDIDRLRQQYSQMNVNAQQNPSSGSSPSENDNNTKADDSKKAN